MQLRTLPGTDLNVSRVCLGTMTWGQQNSEAEAHAQLEYAIEQGINFIDTAEMYPVPPNAKTQGRTEKFLGTWLAKQARASLIIATKVAGPGRRDWIRAGRPHLNQGGWSRPARLDSCWSHRPHARCNRGSGGHQPRALADRLHRPLPDSLAA